MAKKVNPYSSLVGQLVKITTSLQSAITEETEDGAIEKIGFISHTGHLIQVSADGVVFGDKSPGGSYSVRGVLEKPYLVSIELLPEVILGSLN